jgi:hypothetical protein
MAVSDVTGMTSDRYVSMFNDRLGGVAHAKPKPGAAHEPKDRAAIRAFNEKAPSMAGMEPLPSIASRRRNADKVYAKPPPGFTCGSHVFYDKACHRGLTCFRDGAVK